MKTLHERIKQLELQLSDPEILDKIKIENKLESYKEFLDLTEEELFFCWAVSRWRR